MGSTIAGEIGVFGYKPSVLMDMLAGKRAEVGTKVGAYMRTFSGDCSPSDLETALQVCDHGILIFSSLNIFYSPREDPVCSFICDYSLNLYSAVHSSFTISPMLTNLSETVCLISPSVGY